MSKDKNNQNKAREYNTKGNSFFDEGDYNKALDFYSKAVSSDDSFAEGYYNLGLVNKRLGNLDEAINNFKKAVEKNPDYVEALNQIGIHFYDKNQYDEAEEYYLKALKVNDRLDYVYYNLALVEDGRGNKEKKIEYLDKALKLRPNYSLALNEMGNYYYDLSEYDKAKDYYQKALRGDDENKYAYYNLGLIAEIELELEAAKKFYERSLKIDPDYDLPKKKLQEIKNKLDNESSFMENDESNKDETGKEEKSFIDRIGRNLNEEARKDKLSDLIGREKEITTIFEILHKRFKNNPLLIGHPGVGKTAIVEGIAKKIVGGDVPDFFKKTEIVELNIGFLIAGTKYRGEFETKVKKIIDEAKDNENIILFIDEIHTIIGAGRVEDSNLDIAQMLKPALQRGELTCIGATTTNEYRKYLEKDPAFERRFYPVVIEELSAEATKDILNHNIEKANKYYNISYTPQNVEEIVDLTDKYIRKRYFPDKAIDIFEKLGSRMSLKGEKEVTSRDIKDIISESSGIEFVEDDRDELKRLSRLEKEIKKVIFGQDEAVESICNLLRITKRRLDLKPERPDGVFLFTGPTGVGKTYMAKCLNNILFGDDKRLIQLDMSEFSEPHSVAKLIGAPPGYVGYDDVNPLTGKISENPTSILLLDEIEKAHINVIKLFLQVFEEGKITDSRGKKIFFSDVTIIMTSNVLAKGKGPLGFLQDISKEKNRNMEGIINELLKTFPKEFINRIDEIILFNPLSLEDIENIMLKNIITKTSGRFSDEGISLDFDKSVLEKVIEQGYSPELGARNLHRAFESIILSPLVKYIYEKNCKNIKLKLKFDNENLLIKSA